jgi:hypothetical protein
MVVYSSHNSVNWSYSVVLLYEERSLATLISAGITGDTKNIIQAAATGENTDLKGGTITESRPPRLTYR